MENWIAKPLIEVNGIKFGMERKEVRKRFSGNVREFKKTKFSQNTTDDFGICHVYYDENDKCKAIEVFDNVMVSIDGKVIFPININVLKTMISDIFEEDGSFISKQKSIGIYSPDGKMESILFGIKGYYDE